MRIRHINTGTMCPIGRRLVNGTGSMFQRARMVCHCLLVETNDGLALVDTGIGLGDIAVVLRHETLPQRGHRPAVGWFAQAELPTGRARRGLGNGELDFGLGALCDITAKKWYGFLNAGLFVSGGHQLIEQFLKTEYFSYVIGGAYRLSRHLALQTQFHGGTPQLTGIAHQQWDDVPLDIAFGLRGEYPRGFGDNDLFWQLAFSEDLNANGPSIDFTAIGQFGIRWHGL